MTEIVLRLGVHYEKTIGYISYSTNVIQYKKFYFMMFAPYMKYIVNIIDRAKDKVMYMS